MAVAWALMERADKPVLFLDRSKGQGRGRWGQVGKMFDAGTR